jgi:hypothetical protein
VGILARVGPTTLSDDTDARSGLARLEEPEALFAGCKAW